MEVAAYIMVVIVVHIGQVMVITFAALGPTINIAYPAKHPSFTSEGQPRHKLYY